MHIIWKRIYFCVGRKLCNYHSITASKYRVCLTPLNIANQYCLLDLVEKTRLFMQNQQNWVLFWYTRINFTVRHCFYHIEKNGYDYYSEWNFQTYFHFKQLEWKKINYLSTFCDNRKLHQFKQNMLNFSTNISLSFLDVQVSAKSKISLEKGFLSWDRKRTNGNAW